MAEIKSLGLIVGLFFSVRLACVEENGDISQTPVNLRPFQLILPRDHLLGDWYGVRSWLEEQGFIPTLSFATDIAGNPIGGMDQGVTHADNNLLTGLGNILATIPAIALVDRLGRKPSLLLGSAGMALTLGIMAMVFATPGVGPEGGPILGRGAAVTGLSAANLYVVAFAASWGPVMWVLLGEMFPNRLRGAALAVSGATNWGANFLVTVSFLPLLKAVGLAGAYGVFTMAAVVSLVFVWAAVKETKGKTLQEM